MSRSTRKAIIKDRPRNSQKSENYWRKVRRVTNNFIKTIKTNPDNEEIIPNPKNIYNDYDYCDYVWDYENTITGEKYKEHQIKLRRK